eukprot:Nk52_evm88s485 gene=Nk52_evmTU88s485
MVVPKSFGWDGSSRQRLRALIAGCEEGVLDLRAMKVEGADGEVCEEIKRILLERDISKVMLDIDADGMQYISQVVRTSSNGAGIMELSTWYSDFGDAGCVNVALMLQATGSMLSVLDLGYNGIGTAGGRALGEALKGNCVLKELNLQSNKLQKSARCIGEALKENRSLKVLNLQSNSIDDEDVSFVCDCITHSSASSGSGLMVLDVSENKLGELADEALGRMISKPAASNTQGASLAVLNCSSSSFGSGDLRANVLGKALTEEGCKILKLNLSFSRIHIDGISGLSSHGANSFGSLRSLDLSSNNIGDEELAVLTTGLKSSSKQQLRFLGLRSNLLADGSATSICELVNHFCSILLETANEDGHPQILGNTEEDPSLRKHLNYDIGSFYLDLTGNKIGNAGARAVMTCLEELESTLFKNTEGGLGRCLALDMSNNNFPGADVLRQLSKYQPSSNTGSNNESEEEEDFFDSEGIVPSVTSFRGRNLQVETNPEIENEVNARLGLDINDDD